MREKIKSIVICCALALSLFSGYETLVTKKYVSEVKNISSNDVFGIGGFSANSASKVIDYPVEFKTRPTISNTPVISENIGYVDIEAPSSYTNIPASGYARLAGQTVNGQSWVNMIQPDGSSYRLLRDTLFTAFNYTGSTLSNGVVVCFDTGTVTTTHWVKLAKADNSSTMPAQGVIIGGNITNGASGNVAYITRTPTGYLPSAIATLPYGTPLYVSTTEAGGYQSSEPQAGSYRQIVGYVNYNGAMDVRIKESSLIENTAVSRQWNLWPMSNSTVAVGAKAMRLVNEPIPSGPWWTNSITSNNQYVTFCSPAMGLTQFKGGVYTLTINMGMVGSGGPALSESAEVYLRVTNGVETELTPVSGTAAQSIPTGGFSEYIFSLSIPADTVCNATDSVEVKLKSSGRSGTTSLIIKSGTFTVPIPSGQFLTQNDGTLYSNTWTAADAQKANTNNFGEITASSFKTRTTVLDEGDATPTWVATNQSATLNVTQNVLIAIDNFTGPAGYMMKIINNSSKAITWDTDVDWVADELTEAKTNIISFYSWDGVTIYATGKSK